MSVLATDSQHELPELWKSATIDAVTTVCRRGRAPAYAGGVTKVVNQKCVRHKTVVDLTFCKLTNEETRPLPDWAVLKAGDILVNSTGTGTLGRVGWLRDLDARLTVDSHVAVVRPSVELVRPAFLGWFLHANEDALVTASTGSTNQRELSPQSIKDLAIPLPPLVEQDQIVAALERYLDDIETGMAELDRAAARFDAYARSLIDAVVWGDRFSLSPSGSSEALIAQLETERHARWQEEQPKRRYKAAAKVEEPIEVPGGWALASVDAVAALVTDGDHNPPKRRPLGIPHLTARHVTGFGLHFENTTFIAPADFERVRRRYDPMPGDVIVTCVGTIGRVAIVPHDCVFSPDRNLAAVRPLSGIDSRFLMYVLASHRMQRRMATASGSTAQPHLYLGDLRKLPVPVPPLPVQQAVARYLDRHLSGIPLLAIQAAKTANYVARLRASLLKAAFSGLLGAARPTDPSETPSVTARRSSYPT